MARRHAGGGGPAYDGSVALALSLAVLGVLLAVLALLLAIRTERHVRRLARALAHEWGLRTGGGGDPVAPPAERGALSEAQTQLRRSIEDLEQRVFELAARSAASSPPAFVPASGLRTTGASSAAGAPAGQRTPDPRERVRRHLEQLGYEEVVVLPGREGAGSLIYEAREDGMPRKGGARVAEDGRVTLHPAGALRVFP